MPLVYVVIPTLTGFGIDVNNIIFGFVRMDVSHFSENPIVIALFTFNETSDKITNMTDVIGSRWDRTAQWRWNITLEESGRSKHISPRYVSLILFDGGKRKRHHQSD
jgi:hypothetical protein